MITPCKYLNVVVVVVSNHVIVSFDSYFDVKDSTVIKR